MEPKSCTETFLVWTHCAGFVLPACLGFNQEQVQCLYFGTTRLLSTLPTMALAEKTRALRTLAHSCVAPVWQSTPAPLWPLKRAHSCPGCCGRHSSSKIHPCLCWYFRTGAVFSNSYHHNTCTAVPEIVQEAAAYEAAPNGFVVLAQHA